MRACAQLGALAEPPRLPASAAARSTPTTRSQEMRTHGSRRRPLAAEVADHPVAEAVDLQDSLAAEVADHPVAEAVDLQEAQGQSTTALAPKAVTSMPAQEGSPKHRRIHSTPEMRRTIFPDTTAESRGNIGGKW